MNHNNDVISINLKMEKGDRLLKIYKHISKSEGVKELGCQTEKKYIFNNSENELRVYGFFCFLVKWLIFVCRFCSKSAYIFDCRSHPKVCIKFGCPYCKIFEHYTTILLSEMMNTKKNIINSGLYQRS